MEQHTPVEVDDTSLKNAQSMWDSFVKVGKWCIYSTIFILLILLFVYAAS